jgi:hypothetical protein
MSGEYSLAQAIYTRVAYDSTFLSLASGGLHFGMIEDVHEVRKWELSGGVPAITTTTLVQPTWGEYVISGGGETHEASGERFNDVFVRIGAVSLLDMGAAVDAEERIDALITDWVPTHADIAAAFKTNRIFDSRASERYTVPVRFRIWRAGGLYRFRYCLI